MSEININAFAGMDNTRSTGTIFIKKNVGSPKVIVNADASTEGSLDKRYGKTLVKALSGAHSLWAGKTCALCVAGGYLYRFQQNTTTQVGTITGKDYPMSYVEADNKVYMSNPYYKGVFNPGTNTLSAWGVSLPPGPMLTSTSGNLQAGTYHVTMTNVSGTELSGNGPITSITLTAEGGISILNRPSGALVWCTDVNESIFYLVGEVSTIVFISTAEPLPTFLCTTPPYMTDLCYAFGRIWGFGAFTGTMYYSEAYKPHLFKPTVNRFDYTSKGTLIAKVPTGLFVGTEKYTKFLAGTEPDKMVESDAGSGSISGTLAYCDNLPEMGDILGTPEKGYVDVPVWRTIDGIVAGNASGRLFNLTKNKLVLGIPERGASLYRNIDGAIQYLTSAYSGLSGSGAGTIDEDTFNAFKDGKLPTISSLLYSDESRAVLGDTVTCEVRRGGVLI